MSYHGNGQRGVGVRLRGKSLIVKTAGRASSTEMRTGKDPSRSSNVVYYRQRKPPQLSSDAGTEFACFTLYIVHDDSHHLLSLLPRFTIALAVWRKGFSATQPLGQRYAISYHSIFDNKILRKFKPIPMPSLVYPCVPPTIRF
jgi:hypothetical protein